VPIFFATTVLFYVKSHMESIACAPTSRPGFVTPGQRLLDEIPKTGILHVSSSSHVVDSSLVATTTGFAVVKESDGVTQVTTTNLTSRTYRPAKLDAVIGVVTKQGKTDYHEIDVGRGSNRVVLLPVLGFDNATKRCV
jgi:exosome complex RNA-binding protein Rrp4